MDKNVLKRLYFFVLFVVLVYFANKANFSALVGTDNQFFTLFQFFGPIAGGFLGLWGGVSVLSAELLDMLIVGKSFTLLSMLRLLPMVFGALYFALMLRRGLSRIALFVVPLVCIALFVSHPIGRTVWYFSLFWLIPVIAAVVPQHWKGQLFFRSYGATFAAHAVGGAIWIYSVPMAAEQWIALIPIVAYERFLFGLGIAFSYVAFTTVLDYLLAKADVRDAVLIEKKYALFH
ncbi:MAG TPA: hypothetical protein VJK72_04445 [Candidatus Nanoarchaeia archaeon]|nr:hypothetical protein [Candidatus Nanoarchaeia archaeon]